MSENNDASSESNSLSSDSMQPASRRGAPLLRSSVLRPSVLGAASSTLNNASNISASVASTSNTGIINNGNTTTCYTENDGAGDATITAGNPFLRAQQDNNDENKASVPQENAADGIDLTSGSGATTSNDVDDDEVDERPDPLTMLRKNGLERANMFAAAKSSIPRVESSGFVFGQNVHERVVGENVNSESGASKSNNVDNDSTTGELLFSSVAKQAHTDAESAASGAGGSSVSSSADGSGGDGTHSSAGDGKEVHEVKSLTDVAREYEESRAQKRKYEEVETFTGEENEENIVDINCKLFAFVNSNWEERGRGSLRLNDSKSEKCSRVVFRTSGNLRLLLNTKVWADMVVESPSPKSLRLTAMDNTGKIKIFLLMARPMDVHQLHLSLMMRIEAQRSLHLRGSDSINDNSDSDGAVGGRPACAHNGDRVTKNGNGSGVVAAAAAIATPQSDTEEDTDLEGVDLVVPQLPLAAAAVRAHTDASDETPLESSSPKKPLLTAEVNN